MTEDIKSEDGSLSLNTGVDTNFLGQFLTKLLLISVYHTHASMELSLAIAADPGVSDATKTEANKAVERLERTVAEIEKLVVFTNKYDGNTTEGDPS